MNRRDFVRNGSLWTLGAAILTPELIERLEWQPKRLWTGADFKKPIGMVIVSTKDVPGCTWREIRRYFLHVAEGGSWTSRPISVPYHSTAVSFEML